MCMFALYHASYRDEQPEKNIYVRLCSTHCLIQKYKINVFYDLFVIDISRRHIHLYGVAKPYSYSKRSNGHCLWFFISLN